MKRNAFGEEIAQPGDSWDDLALPYMERHGLEKPPEVYGARVMLDEDFGWCAEIDVEDGGLIEAHDFENKPQLLMWLASKPGIMPSKITEQD